MADDTSTVSILIRSGDLGDRLSGLVEALDAQTLPYSRYDVTFLHPGSSDNTSERLAELADRRPNVRVLHDEAGTGPDWRSAAETARGVYLLFLSPDDLLFPDGLAALLDGAAEGHDLVVARGGTSWPVGFLPDAIGPAAGPKPIDPAASDAPIAVLAPFALIRRTALLKLSDDLLAGRSAPFRAVRVTLLAAGGSVAACDRPVGVGDGPADGETAAGIWAEVGRAVESLAPEAGARFVAAHATHTLERFGATGLGEDVAELMTELVRRHWQDRDPQTLPFAQRDVVAALAAGNLAGASVAAKAAAQLELVAESTSAVWEDGVLALTIRGAVRAVPAEVLSGLDVRLSIHRLPNRVEYDLATDTTLETHAEGAATFVAHCAVDIAKAAAGAPLPLGNWEIRGWLIGTGSAAAITAVAPACKVPGAVIDGTPVTAFQTDDRLRLDIGAHDHGLLSDRFTPERAQISETARGALLTLSIPDLVVRGRETIPSELFLGGFRLPATFRPTDHGAQLECYVSGLAGVCVLESKIGAAKRQPTGLQLRIGGAGEMTVEVAARPAASRAPGAKKPATKPAPKPVSPAAKPVSPAAKPAAKPATVPGPATPTGKSTGAPTRHVRRGGRIIRRVPRPFRPLARAAADTPVIQAAYRRITGRG